MGIKWGLWGDAAMLMTWLACGCQPAAAASSPVVVTISAPAAEAPQAETSDAFIMPRIAATDIVVDLPQALATIAKYTPKPAPPPTKTSPFAPFFRSLRRVLLRCVEQTLKRNPHLDGKFVVRILGTAAGQTVVVEGIGAGSPLLRLRLCIEHAYRRGELPVIRHGNFDISYPVTVQSR